MTVADRIRALPIWPSPPRLRRISAGRTNENFVVESDGRSFFARLGTDRPEHGISREQEASLARSAAELGIAPEVHFAEGGLLVTDFIDGEPLTAEMIVGPTKALFMDEITNGLDSSTAFQIVKSLQQLAHITDATVLVSLLQPAPESYDLFDDIVLMAEGKIVYHGPRHEVLNFFEECGFRCPERKGVADFLQEVRSQLLLKSDL